MTMKVREIANALGCQLIGDEEGTITGVAGMEHASPGELTFQVNRRVVDEVLVVSDEEIVRAMRFLLERMKLVVEPSGAVAVAALLAGKAAGRGTRIGAILSGGNVSAARLAELLTANTSSG